MEIDTEYKNQEELYRGIVEQQGCYKYGERRGKVCFDMSDTGVSYELTHKGLQRIMREEPYAPEILKNIGVTIELPQAIGEGATSYVVMHASIRDAGYVEGAIEILGQFKRRLEYIDRARDTLKKYTVAGIDFSSKSYKHTDDGVEVTYDIPTKNVENLADIVGLFSFKHL